MKHIFTVHSPITYFCAANVVIHENLKKEDVIFLYTKFVPPKNIGKVIPSFYEAHNTWFKKIRTFNLVKSYDRYITKITDGAEFTAYIDLAHYYQKILITHSLCKAFHFIEEGTASYFPPNDLHSLSRIEIFGSFRVAGYRDKFRAIFRILRGFNLKLLALPYFANAYTFLKTIKFYGFHNEIFPGVLPNKKVILIPNQIALSLGSDYADNFSNSLILVEDSYFDHYGINKKEKESCFERSVEVLRNHIVNQQVFIKLRPHQSEDQSNWANHFKRNNLSYKIIPSGVILEDVLLGSKNCRIIGTVSSLLFYATIFGHKAFSNYSMIEEKPMTTFDHIKFYWDQVRNLENFDDKKTNNEETTRQV